MLLCSRADACVRVWVCGIPRSSLSLSSSLCKTHLHAPWLVLGSQPRIAVEVFKPQVIRIHFDVDLLALI